MTPNLDRLAREGIRFANMYATGTRTVRGLEAVSLGTPPVPGQAIVRRPDNAHLSTMGELLEHQGFATSFVYGGYGMFDNMNAYFDANDYRVVDRRDVPEGIDRVRERLGRGRRVAVRQCDSRRRRQRREGRADVHAHHDDDEPPPVHLSRRAHPDPVSGGREGGVMYTDWAIGKFVEDARTRPWFDETLFVFIADHCAAVAGKTKLPVAGYRIPLILWAPGLVARPSTSRW